MRVTADKKRATRARLLEVAEQLLAEAPLARTTTRAVAERAGVAHGTLFNYFATKEALALQLTDARLARAAADADARSAEAASLEEDLFILAAEALRALRPYRAWVGDLLGATFGPGVDGLPADAPADESDPYRLKARHLAGVRARVEARLGRGAAPDPALHLWWSLWLGVLAWWAADDSPAQEDTLAVLDQAVSMFVASLGDAATKEPRDAR